MEKIKIEKASIAKGINVIIKDLNWLVESGQHWIISGNCGVGKTTLVEFLAYKHRLATGSRSYPFLGENPSMEKFRKAVRYISFMDTTQLFQNLRDIHYYQQRFNAFDSDGHLTARQYIEHDGYSIEGNERLLKAIGIYDLLDLDRIKLSSGQTRKLLLAKVLLSQPQILIIDNPYLGLDKESRKVLNDLLDTLAKDPQLTIILSGHHKELPKCVNHRLHFQNDGSFKMGLLEDTIPEEPNLSMDQQLLAEIKNCFDEKDPHGLSEILSLKDVSVIYDGKEILKPINWQVKPGEKWVIYGPNGIGKSTLLSLIYADNPQAYSKEIYLFGRKRGTGETIWDIKRQIGFTSPELHAYFRENHQAMQIVLTGLTDTFVLRKKPTDGDLKLAQLLFHYFGIEEAAEMPFRKCSTGTQRLILFMRSLIKVPPVLLLDEPFQGLDEIFIEKAKRLLEHVLRPDQSLIFISHYRKEWPGNIQQVLDLT